VDFPSRRLRPAGPRRGGQVGAPNWRNELDHPGVVWLPVVSVVVATWRRDSGCAPRAVAALTGRHVGPAAERACSGVGERPAKIFSPFSPEDAPGTGSGPISVTREQALTCGFPCRDGGIRTHDPLTPSSHAGQRHAQRCLPRSPSSITGRVKESRFLARASLRPAGVGVAWSADHGPVSAAVRRLGPWAGDGRMKVC
jgi:hypothetical protein